jgi:hypothetical protein
VCEVRAECKLDLDDNAPASVEGKTGGQGGLVIIQIKDVFEARELGTSLFLIMVSLVGFVWCEKWM